MTLAGSTLYATGLVDTYSTLFVTIELDIAIGEFYCIIKKKKTPQLTCHESQNVMQALTNITVLEMKRT